jgi:hypothetical protein
VSKNIDKTIREAQEFIDSVRKFNRDDQLLTYSLRDPGYIASSSSDNSIPSDLEEIEEQLPQLPPEPPSIQVPDFPSFSKQELVPSNSEKQQSNHLGFPTLTFSRRNDNPFRADLLTSIETYYYTNKKLPTTKELGLHFKSHPECPKYYTHWAPLLDDIADSLSNRGIRPYNTTDEYVDPKFAWAVSLVVNILDKRTIPAKLKEAGLSTKRYYEYFQNRLDEVFDQDVKNDAKLALARAIQNGDLQAVKYYNELKNIYRPETQTAQQMVAVVLTAIMEILATHVSSEILNRIAVEIRESPSVLKVINTTSS